MLVFSGECAYIFYGHFSDDRNKLLGKFNMGFPRHLPSSYLTLICQKSGAFQVEKGLDDVYMYVYIWYGI